MKIVSTLCSSIPVRWKSEVNNLRPHASPVVVKGNTAYLNFDGDVKNRRRLVQLRLSNWEAENLAHEILKELGAKGGSSN